MASVGTDYIQAYNGYQPAAVGVNGNNASPANNSNTSVALTPSVKFDNYTPVAETKQQRKAREKAEKAARKAQEKADKAARKAEKKRKDEEFKQKRDFVVQNGVPAEGLDQVFSPDEKQKFLKKFKWDKKKETWKEKKGFWGVVTRIAKAAVGGVIGGAAGFLTGGPAGMVKGAVGGIINGAMGGSWKNVVVGSAISGALSGFMSNLGNSFSTIKDGFKEGFKAGFKSMGSNITQGFKNMGTAFKGNFSHMFSSDIWKSGDGFLKSFGREINPVNWKGQFSPSFDKASLYSGQAILNPFGGFSGIGGGIAGTFGGSFYDQYLLSKTGISGVASMYNNIYSLAGFRFGERKEGERVNTKS